MSKEEKQSTCFRCKELLYNSELKRGRDQFEYCEHCYDDMFVSWDEAFQRRKKTT